MHGKVKGKINQLHYNPYLYMYNSPIYVKVFYIASKEFGDCCLAVFRAQDPTEDKVVDMLILKCIYSQST